MGVVLPTLQDAYSKVALPAPIPDNPSVEPVPRKKFQNGLNSRLEPGELIYSRLCLHWAIQLSTISLYPNFIFHS